MKKMILTDLPVMTSSSNALYWLIFAAFLLTNGNLAAQGSRKKRVLFIGNSYVYTNNLPQLIADAALSTGDTVIFDSSTPGGQTLQQHNSNTTSLSKIAQGNWDFVVLQEQSQMPSFPQQQVVTSVFPYAKRLDSLINAKNPCAETIFYMTWGRKNGDAGNCAGWPAVCTYEGMDDLLQQRYAQMATDNNAILSPVAKVWRALRAQYPTLELYNADESHPSLVGSYAAACTFYSVIFRKDPALITWNSTLDAAVAGNIRNVVKTIVYNSLETFHVGDYDPIATFTSSSNGQTTTFTNTSQHASAYLWDFGDGQSSTLENPVHTYTGNGPFQVKLIAKHCAMSDFVVHAVGVAGISTLGYETRIAPNPANNKVQISGSRSLQGMVVRMIQTDGKEIMKRTVDQNSEMLELEIAGIPDGIYFISIQALDGQVAGMKKLVIQH